MIRRRGLGQTGLELSVVGFGTSQLQLVPVQQAIATLSRGFELGVSWVHTAIDYHGADRLVASAIRQSGRKVAVFNQADGDPETCKAYFERTCEMLDQNRLAGFGIGCIDDAEGLGQNVWGSGGTVDLLQAYKNDGRLKAVFCSTHGPPDYVARLIRSGAFDAIMLAYNPLGHHLLSYFAASEGWVYEDLERNRNEVFPLAREHGVGLLVMKPLAGGLLCSGKAFPAWAGAPMPPRQLQAGDVLRTIIGLDGVCAVVTGTASVDEAEENARAGYEPASIQEDDECRHRVAVAVSELRRRLCNRCGECEATCSRSLPISWLLRDFYLRSSRSGVYMAEDRLSYFLLHPEVQLRCDTCDDRSCICPHGIDIPHELGRAHKLMLELSERAVVPRLAADAPASGPHRLLLSAIEAPLEIPATERGICRVHLGNAGDRAWRAHETVLELLVEGVSQQQIALRADVHPGGHAHFAFEIAPPPAGPPRRVDIHLLSVADPEHAAMSTHVVTGRLLAATAQGQEPGVRWGLLLDQPQALLRAPAEPAPQSGEHYGARYLENTLPREVAADAFITAQLRVCNTSSFPWNAQDSEAQKHKVALVIRIDKLPVATVDLPCAEVPPQGEATFEFEIEAPSRAGMHALQFDLEELGVTYFKDRRVRPLSMPLLVGSAVPAREPRYGVEYLDHTVPDSLPVGAVFGAQITLRNTCSFTWRPHHPDGHNVDLVLLIDGEVKGTYQLPLEAVQPGGLVTVPFPLTAPAAPGAHQVQLEMVEQGIARFRDRGVPPIDLDLAVSDGSISETSRLFAVASAVNPYHYHPSRGINLGARGACYPLFASRAAGCHIWDPEGNEYLEYTMGWGSVLLGYNHPRVVNALHDVLDETSPILPFPHPLELEVSQMLVEDFPSAEMITFGKNGSDACTVAARMARIATGRNTILYSGYHGWQDFWVEQAGFANTGVPDRPQPLIHRFRFNDSEHFLELCDLYRHDLAGVMIEPSGPWGGERCGPEADIDRGFLNTVADATRDAGAVLVFDEIVTGYRYPGGSVQGATGVIPDITCLGKAIASGMPLSAVLGRRDLMTDALSRAHYGPTFKGEVYSFAAARAAIEIYRSEPVAEHVWSYGERLREGIDSLIAATGVRAACKGPPFRMAVVFTEPDDALFRIKRTLWVQELLKRSVITYFGVMLPSWAHDDDCLQHTLAVVEEVLAQIAAAERTGRLDSLLEIPLL